MYSQDERTLAMLAHGSALLNVFTGIGGIIAALVIYLFQKDKSAWVGFQSLQALIYQVIVTVGFWVLAIISSVLISVLIGCLLLPFTILLGLAAIVYSVYAAYKTYQGVDFRYSWLGDWLATQSFTEGPPPPVV